ncbi:hypothetical protein QEN19_002711 [Hanseniaspora menglaensis]
MSNLSAKKKKKPSHKIKAFTNTAIIHLLYFCEMPIDIAPKQQVNIKPVVSGGKKLFPTISQSENTLNRKVVLIKRSKSTGIVLKQKKRKKQPTPPNKQQIKPSGSIFNITKQPTISSIKQNSQALFPLDTGSTKISTALTSQDGSIERTSSATCLNPDHVKKEEMILLNIAAKNNMADSSQRSVSQRVSEASLDTKKISAGTAINDRLSAEVPTISSNASTSSAGNSVFSSKSDVLTEKAITEAIDFNLKTLQRIDSQSNKDQGRSEILDRSETISLHVLRDHPVEKKNGLNTPPLSNFNTTTNSDVEILLDDINDNGKNNNDPNDPILQKIHNKNDNQDVLIAQSKSTNATGNIHTPLVLTNQNIENLNNDNKRINIQQYQKENQTELVSSLNENINQERKLSTIVSESVPMTPSYTASSDNTNKHAVYTDTSLQVLALKSPKEEELNNGTKLSKKASLLKKKIVQRKNKNNILKLELNDLIESLQLLKKQYDMISNAFGDSNNNSLEETSVVPNSLFGISNLNPALKKVSEQKQPIAAVKNEIPGYYFKRTNEMIYDENADNANPFVPKKRKTAASQDDHANLFMKSDNILSNITSVNNFKTSNENGIDINLMSIQDILQQPDPQSIDLDVNFNTSVNNTLFAENNESSNTFDFFINESMNIDNDINMDFLNF